MHRRGEATNPGQRTIGITGGIAMGKTAVADYLAAHHQLPVLDADVFAREAVAPGSWILAQIEQRYGSGVLLPDGSLNRQRLGNIVFQSPAERLWLEQQIHPYVRDRLETAMRQPPYNSVTAYPVLVLVVPLLFEARMTDLVTESWVVRSPDALQLKRLMERDGLTLEEAQNRINSQMTIQKKAAQADVVLDNDGSLEDLYAQVDQALAQAFATDASKN